MHDYKKCSKCGELAHPLHPAPYLCPNHVVQHYLHNFIKHLTKLPDTEVLNRMESMLVPYVMQIRESWSEKAVDAVDFSHTQYEIKHAVTPSDIMGDRK